jgi:hypothetical protein
VPRTQRPQNQPQARDEKQENRKIIFQKYAYIHDSPDYHLQGGPLFCHDLILTPSADLKWFASSAGIAKVHKYALKTPAA